MRNKDQILLENIYLKVLKENQGYRMETGGSGSSKDMIDEVRIGNDSYSIEYDVDLTRSVEDHGTFYDEPNIEIHRVWKYDPQIDDNVEIPWQQLQSNPELLKQLEAEVQKDIDHNLDNERYSFHGNEPDHEDI